MEEIVDVTGTGFDGCGTEHLSLSSTVESMTDLLGGDRFKIA